jgi:lysophospholipase L1-like esterase
MCQPVGKLRTTQFGWGGETAGGFAGRMANDMLRFNPSVATTCFGMNDGGYSPMTPDKAKRYRDAQQSIVEKCKQAGIRTIVVGSPGCVDTDTFRNDPAQAVMYNKTLSEERDIAREVAQSQQVVFADVYTPMIEAMAKAKAKYGKAYHVAGGDGFHPDQNGHLIMAYAFLKALGCSGEIGTITVDLAAGKAEATDGHKILSCQNGKVDVESTRYPFCFSGDATKPGATKGIIEFFPFNEDLNRYTLVVKAAPGDKLKVTWGQSSKEFSAAQLAKGVNLAAELLENPFSQPFQKVEAQIRAKQNFETPLVKTLLHNLPEYKQLVPEEADALERIAAGAMKRDKALADASTAAVEPVRHQLVIEAVK